MPGQARINSFKHHWDAAIFLKSLPYFTNLVAEIKD